ncbi:MAG: 50S ribosomal protein L37ae [Candidatus Bathyarchaeia archaeon]
MGHTKKVGMMGRYGARFGSTLRKRRGEIEAKMRRRHTCPRCIANAVRRVSVGVWQCKRCGFTFAGGAYTPSTKIGEMLKKSKLSQHP